jgi:hypothetical protein
VITLKYVISHICGCEKMPNLTLSIPADVQEDMHKYPEIRWSEVARQAIIRKLEDLKRLDELNRDSKLTLKDVGELDHLVKKSAAAKLRKMAKGMKG